MKKWKKITKPFLVYAQGIQRQRTQSEWFSRQFFRDQ